MMKVKLVHRYKATSLISSHRTHLTYPVHLPKHTISTQPINLLYCIYTTNPPSPPTISTHPLHLPYHPTLLIHSFLPPLPTSPHNLPQASLQSLESLDEDDDDLANAALVEKFVLSPMMVIPRSKGAIELPSHRNPPPKLTENGTSVITTLPPIPKTDGSHSVYARPPPKVWTPTQSYPPPPPINVPPPPPHPVISTPTPNQCAPSSSSPSRRE